METGQAKVLTELGLSAEGAWQKSTTCGLGAAGLPSSLLPPVRSQVLLTSLETYEEEPSSTTF